MTWLRVDDKFPRHPKVAALNDREFRVHVRLLCWCSEYGTEGNVPEGAFNDVAGLTRKMGRRFIELGLWDEQDGCFVIHDFQEYRPKDPSNADRQRAWRERNGKRNASRNATVTEESAEEVTDGVTDSYTCARVPVPVPALPAEEVSTSKDVSPDLAVGKRLLSYANTTLGHRWKLTDGRKSKIRARLREGYTEEQLRQAIDGALKDPWDFRCVNNNDDPAIIFRDATHVDRFMAFAAANGRDPQQQSREIEQQRHHERIAAMQRERGWVEPA